MPSVLRHAAYQAAIEELLESKGSNDRKFYMKELAFLVANYNEGTISVVSDMGFSKGYATST